MPPHTLVIATANPHKVAELRDILAASVPHLRIAGLSDLPGSPFPQPDETGTTFEANVRIKALAYARATGMYCLADDSGLEIDALQGRPGVISSHYATDGRETGLSREARDEANNRRVMRELEYVPAPMRSARFVCVMALACPALGSSNADILHLARGDFEGRIGEAHRVPRGQNGFGYDPLFLVAPDFTRTSAELSSAEKDARSHRAHAAALIAAWLRDHPLPT